MPADDLATQRTAQSWRFDRLRICHILMVTRIAMPIYEFECARCGERIELMLNVADRNKGKCPKCGGTELRKLYGSVHLGGSEGASSACSGCKASTCTGCSLSSDT